MALKAALVLWHHGVRIGVVAETDTGHMVEWRFSTNPNRPVRTPVQEASVSHQRRIGTYAWFWERVPAMSVYGTDGFDIPLRLDPPVSPRELFQMMTLPTYSPHGLWFVEPEVSVDDLYGAGLRGADLGVPYLEVPELVPTRGCPRPDGTKMVAKAPLPPYVAATVEMLASGIVGYRYTEDGLAPIRAHSRFEVPIGDRARLRTLLGESFGQT